MHVLCIGSSLCVLLIYMAPRVPLALPTRFSACRFSCREAAALRLTIISTFCLIPLLTRLLRSSPIMWEPALCLSRSQEIILFHGGSIPMVHNQALLLISVYASSPAVRRSILASFPRPITTLQLHGLVLISSVGSPAPFSFLTILEQRSLMAHRPFRLI